MHRVALRDFFALRDLGVESRQTLNLHQEISCCQGTCDKASSNWKGNMDLTTLEKEQTETKESNCYAPQRKMKSKESAHLDFVLETSSRSTAKRSTRPSSTTWDTFFDKCSKSSCSSKVVAM